MERARAISTDECLDDLSRRVEDGFNRVDGDLRQLRAELNIRFDSLHRLVVQTSGGMVIAVLATLVSVLATRA